MADRNTQEQNHIENKHARKDNQFLKLQFICKELHDIYDLKSAVKRRATENEAVSK